MANETTFNDHPLLDFQKLLIGNTSEIARLENEFRTHGWCFVLLPKDDDQIKKKINHAQRRLNRFFAHSEQEKSRYVSSTAFGYSRIDHKEGIKILTDQYGRSQPHQTLPTEIEDTLNVLAVFLRHFTDLLQSIIYKMPTVVNSSSRHTVALSNFTMLDIVNYFNERTGPAQVPNIGLNTHEVNCVPHFDPGLFSLSILSTCDGLQLKDRLRNNWVDGPVNTQADQQYIAAIWLGEAASHLTQNQFQTGIHRVIYPRTPHQARLTIWQEVCTISQIEPLLNNTSAPAIYENGTVVELANQPESLPMKIRSDANSYNQLMRKVEKERGISMSKSGRHYVRSVEKVENDDEDYGNARRSSAVKTHHDYLPGGASVTMKNQPNSVPMPVKKGGESVNNFMKRIEVDRGLSMSKSGIDHFDFDYPLEDDQQQEPNRIPAKKSSFLTNIFRK